MEFWSRGLGSRWLVLDLGRERVEADAERVALSGHVSAPVTWNYIMYLEPCDWSELFELALRRELASFLLSRRRLLALGRLTAFLFRFVALYLSAWVRVRRGRAPEPCGVTATPDFRSRAEIDPAALVELEPGAERSTRRPRPRRTPRGDDANEAASPPPTRG